MENKNCQPMKYMLIGKFGGRDEYYEKNKKKGFAESKQIH